MANQIKKKYLSTEVIDYFDSQIANVASDLAAEIVNREAADVQVLSDAKAYTDTKVSDLVNGAPAMLDTLKELADALGNDANLAGTIAGQVGQISSDLQAEITRAQTAEDALEASISQEATNRAAEILQEATARASADTVLQGNIDQEAVARQAADDALDGKIDQEIFDRSEADTLLQTQIDNLGTSLSGDYLKRDGSNAMTGALDVGGNDIINVGNMQANTVQVGPMTLSGGQMFPLIPAYVDLNGAKITNMNPGTSPGDAVEFDQLSVEIGERQTADAGLQSNIDSEESARIAEDLTFLKLNGSRSMSGSLDMGSAPGQPGAVPVLWTTFSDPTRIGSTGNGQIKRTDNGFNVGPVPKASTDAFTGDFIVDGMYKHDTSVSTLGTTQMLVGIYNAGDTYGVYSGAIVFNVGSATAYNASGLINPSLVHGQSYSFRIQRVGNTIKTFVGGTTEAHKMSEYTNAGFSAFPQLSVGVGITCGYSEVTSLSKDGVAVAAVVNKIINLSDGVLSSDAINKGQLDSAISTESAARVSGDASTLSSANTYTDGKFSTEQAARIAGDSSTLNSANSYTDSEIAAEVIDRQAGDAATLSSANTYTDGKIAVEVAAREAGDSAAVSSANNYTDGKIATEVSDRQAGDASVLSSANSYTDSEIADEVTARLAGDANLQSQINNIVENTDPAALDSLKEIVDAFQAADSNLNTTITNLSTSASSALGVETAAREAADLVLQGNIDAEALARATADTLESQARQLADETLQDNIDAEAVLRQQGDSALSTQIGNEIVDRAAADTVLQNNIDAEVENRTNADGILQGNIDAEESARIAEDLTFLKLDGSRMMEGPLDMGGQDINSAMTINGQTLHASNEVIVGDLNSQYVSVNLMNISTSGDYVIWPTGNLTLNTGGDVIFSANGKVQSYAEMDMDSHKITSLADGTMPSDAATKGQVDTAELNAAGYTDSAIAQEVSDRQAGDAATLSSANSYTDGKVATEKSEREAADSALDGRLDLLEAKAFYKYKVVYSSGTYIDLPHEAAPNSICAFVDRLAIHEGVNEDYSVSVVGGVTRITFLNDMVHPSAQKLQAGDQLYFTYYK